MQIRSIILSSKNLSLENDCKDGICYNCKNEADFFLENRLSDELSKRAK